MPGATVVLVHGEFADSAGFAAVVPLLLDDGLSVVVPAVPNRSLTGDAAYIAAVVRQIAGPVLLVGHSYGGAVVTVAGVEDNVVGLVYLAAYALEEGESVRELQDHFPGTDLGAAVVSATFPVEDGEEGIELLIAADRFHAVVAHDVDPALTRVLAVSQRPVSAAAFAERASAAAWKTKPSWGAVSSADRTINPDVERFVYHRAGMTTIEVNASHLVMLSHPLEVADLIRRALRSVTR